MEPEYIPLSQTERNRLRVLHEIEPGHLTQVEAACRLQITDRQVRRLLVGLQRRGDCALVHGLRGQPSNRRLEPAAGPTPSATGSTALRRLRSHASGGALGQGGAGRKPGDATEVDEWKDLPRAALVQVISSPNRARRGSQTWMAWTCVRR